MAYLTVDQVREGMVLAAPVTDRRGRLLIPAGKELTERHVEALRMWGVSHVEIDGDGPDAEESGFDPEVQAEAERRVAERFGDARGRHAFLDALFTHAVAAEARALHEAGGPS